MLRPLLLALLLAGLGRPMLADERVPNFVVFLVDDMGWTDVGCQGNRFHETPHVDRLAREGMRFTDAYAACPVCSPTRASVVTGRYPGSVDITDFISGHWKPYAKTVVPRFRFELPHAEVTFAEHLKARGYVSGAFGKWHLGGESHYPGTQGFDDWIVTTNRAFAPGFRPRASRPLPPEPNEYQANYLTRAAERFLEDHADEPFALYLSHSDVHIPLEAEDRLIAKYREKAKQPEFAPRFEVTLVWTGDRPGNVTETVAQLVARGEALTGATVADPQVREDRATVTVTLPPDADVAESFVLFRRNVDLVQPPEGVTMHVRPTVVNHPVYAAMCEHVDESLGRIVAKLDQLKLADDTVVIFTSDNGGLYRRFDDTGPATSSQHPLRGEKGSLYEGGVRVPWIVRWPGVVEAGTTSAEPVSTVDLFPTMSAAAGLPVPENVDGASLVPVLRGEAFAREAIFWHYPHYHHTTPAGSIRAGRYKLIEYFEDDRLELFDLETDLGEYRNLATTMPDMAIELRRRLAEWRKQVGAKLPTSNPNHDEERAAEWGNRRDRGF